MQRTHRRRSVWRPFRFHFVTFLKVGTGDHGPVTICPVTFARSCRLLCASHPPRAEACSASAARAPSRAAFLFARATDRQSPTHRPPRPGRLLATRLTDGRCRPNPRKHLAEADVLVRLRLKEIGLEVPHLVVAVMPDGEVVLRSNVSPDVLRSLEERRPSNSPRQRWLPDCSHPTSSSICQPSSA